MQRYIAYIDHSCGEPSISIEPDKDGDLVYYDEVEKRIAEMKSALQTARLAMLDVETVNPAIAEAYRQIVALLDEQEVMCE
jgi:hypothetical protein